MEDPTAAQAQRKRLKLPLAPANLLENVSSTAMHSRNADVPLRNASLSALTRRTSLPVGQYRDDVMKDEDSLLRSKWSIEMFPELVADRSQHDLHLLGRWLQVEVDRFNKLFTRRSAAVPEAEFLVVAAQHADKVYNHAFRELLRQVSAGSQERGQLLESVWGGLNSTLIASLLRLREQAALYKDRMDAAESTLATKTASLQSENNKLHADLDRSSAQLMELKAAHRAAAIANAQNAAQLPELAHLIGRATPEKSAQRPTIVRAAGGAVAFQEGNDPDGPAHAGEDFASEGRPHTAASKQDSTGADAEGAGSAQAKAKAAKAKAPRLLQDDSFNMEQVSPGDLGGLTAQNGKLREALEACRGQLSSMNEQMLGMEKAADEGVAFQSRAEAAEAQRDAAVDRMRAMTPRPPLPRAMALPAALGAEGTQRFVAALAKTWPPLELAQLLVGVSIPDRGGLMQTAPSCLGCLARPLFKKRLQHDDIVRALADGLVKPLTEHITQAQFTWLQALLSGVAAAAGDATEVTAARKRLAPGLACFLAGCSEQGYKYSSEFYGCLVPFQADVSVVDVLKGIEEASVSTVDRCAKLQAELDQMEAQLADTQAALQEQVALSALKDLNRKRAQDADAVAKRNPVLVYIEKLAAADESEWKDNLEPMGAGPDIPRMFRTAAKIRNKQVTKHFTEKTIKEIWKEKMAANKSGAKMDDMCEFVCNYFQKRLGIMAAVVEMGYNLLYGLWKYAWDADCELFLKILEGETKEDVYVQQVQLQEDLEAMFAYVDKQLHGTEQGALLKAEAHAAIENYFQVGLPGGKTLDRFDELVQALEEDQEGPTVVLKDLFKEDREFNQGEFAEACRDQFMKEREEYFTELEQKVLDETMQDPDCNRAQLAAALMKMDPELPEAQASHFAVVQAEAVFDAGLQTHSVKLVLKRLQGRAVNKTRPKLSAAIIVKLKLLGAAARKKGGKGPPTPEKATREAKEAPAAAGTGDPAVNVEPQARP